MIFKETYVLANGVKIPRFALGTWQVSNEDAGGAVKNALKIGYRIHRLDADSCTKALERNAVRNEKIF